MATITLVDILLTPEQRRLALKLYRARLPARKTYHQPSFARQLCKQVIEPNLAAIEAHVGQQCDPMFLAYAVEHILNQTRRAP